MGKRGGDVATGRNWRFRGDGCQQSCKLCRPGLRIFEPWSLDADRGRALPPLPDPRRAKHLLHSRWRRGRLAPFRVDARLAPSGRLHGMASSHNSVDARHRQEDLCFPSRLLASREGTQASVARAAIESSLASVHLPRRRKRAVLRPCRDLVEARGEGVCEKMHR